MRSSDVRCKKGGAASRPPSAPVSIRWCRVAHTANGPLDSWTPVVVRPRAGGAVSIRSDGPLGRRGCGSVEGAVRQALSGLAGRWRAHIAPIDACCVDIQSPDGLRCLAFIPSPHAQVSRTVAQRLREACESLCALTPRTRWRGMRVLVTEQGWRG